MKYVSSVTGAPVAILELDEFQAELLKAWHVKLVHSDQDVIPDDLLSERAYRFQRLMMIKGAIIKYSLLSAFKIVRLGDHKGQLTVTWNVLPQPEEQALLEWIWSLFGAELRDSVKHEVSQERLVNSDRFSCWRD